MTRSIDDILSEAMQLSAEDRASVARELLASLWPEPADDKAWEAEIQRREREIDAGTVDLISAEDVFDELDTLLQ
jgi:putative addiction module component (TIGR02574 family)